MKDCIFCKIATHEIPSEIIYENESHVAFLDINPTTEGMTVVVPKKHFDSDFYSNDAEIICAIMSAARGKIGVRKGFDFNRGNGNQPLTCKTLSLL